MVALSLSMLNADFANLRESLAPAAAHADFIHVDIMDGSLSPMISFGTWILPVLSSFLGVPLEVHLYVSSSRSYYDKVVAHDASRILVDVKTASEILEGGSEYTERVCLYLLPSFARNSIDVEMLARVSLVNLVTVESLWGGQSISWTALQESVWLDSFRCDHGLDFEISVDGGINKDTLERVLQYPIDQVVVGSAILRAKDPSLAAAEFKSILGSTHDLNDIV